MFPARGGTDEIEITLTVSSLTMLSNCAAWSMIDRLATLKNSAKLRGLGGWRYEPRQVRGAGDSAKLPVCTERRKLIFRGKIQCAELTAVKLGSNFLTANWIEGVQRRWPAMTAFECVADEICSNRAFQRMTPCGLPKHPLDARPVSQIIACRRKGRSANAASNAVAMLRPAAM